MALTQTEKDLIAHTIERIEADLGILGRLINREDFLPKEVDEGQRELYGGLATVSLIDEATNAVDEFDTNFRNME